MFRAFLALVGLAFASASMVLFGALGWMVWPLKTEVTRQADALAEKANRTADAADHSIGFVRDVTARAEAELSVVRLQPTDRPRMPVNPFLQVTAIKASQDLVGSVERAQGAVVAATDAVVVADVTLTVASGYPELKQFIGVSPEQLNMTRSALASVAEELRNARGILGCCPEANQLTAEQLNTVDAALVRVKDITEQIASIVATTRNKVNETRDAVDVWSQRIALGMTLVSALGIVGQLFMARFCWRKLRRFEA
jgi:hypothetical protein